MKVLFWSPEFGNVLRTALSVQAAATFLENLENLKTVPGCGLEYGSFFDVSLGTTEEHDGVAS